MRLFSGVLWLIAWCFVLRERPLWEGLVAAMLSGVAVFTFFLHAFQIIESTVIPQVFAAIRRREVEHFQAAQRAAQEESKKPKLVTLNPLERP